MGFGRSSDDLLLGWQAPNIKPYDKICLDPSASVFHYGLECFEGMKAYVYTGYDTIRSGLLDLTCSLAATRINKDVSDSSVLISTWLE